MLPGRALVLTAGLCSAAGIVSAQTVTDRQVARGAPVVVELRGSASNAFEVFERLLQEARVPYGIERVFPSATPPPLDPGQRPDAIATIHTTSLREALDRVVSVDPRYAWAEEGGRVIVRVAAQRGGVGLLDRAVPAFSFQRTPIEGVLSALMRTLDPARPPGGIGRFGLGFASDDTPALAGPAQRPVTLDLPAGTYGEALNAIATASRGCWTVRYEGPAFEPDIVAVTLNVEGGGFTALPSRLVRAAADPASRSRIRVPTTLGIASGLGIYAQRLKVRLGVELLPEDAPRIPAGAETTSIDVTGLPAAQAVGRIVAHDDRFTWVEKDGIFSVRPRPDLSSRSPLDHRVGRFVVEGHTVDRVLDRVAALLGGTMSGAGSGRGGRAGSEEWAAAEQDRARTVTFALEDATLRDILDELCRAQQTLSWTVRIMRQPTSGVLVSINLSSWTGWSSSRSVRLSSW